MPVQGEIQTFKGEVPNDWNFSWADCINKELKTKKRKVKKALDSLKPKEIDDNDNDNNEDDCKEKILEHITKTELKFRNIEKKKCGQVLRTKPSITDISNQKSLKKIATKGVVHFFNAVKSQQKMLAQSLENERSFQKREDFTLKNIDKTKFLNILLGTPKSESAS